MVIHFILYINILRYINNTINYYLIIITQNNSIYIFYYMIIYFNNKLLYVILYVLFINILLIMYLENCMTFLRIEINIIITIQKKKK